MRKMRGINEIHGASKREKISILESVSQADEAPVIRKTISLLNDPDIEVRGEAFSSLVINKNDLSTELIESLKDGEKNVRAFATLVLANRRDGAAVEPLKRMTRDSSSMVRSCALGALGYIGASGAGDEIRSCFTDESVEVKRSALKAAIDTGCGVSDKELEEFSREGDRELDRLVVMAGRTGSGQPRAA